MSKTLQVKVNPNSSRVKISEMADGTVKVNLTAAPEAGDANEQLIEVLADEHDIDTSRINIKGKTSPRKTVVIK